MERASPTLQHCGLAEEASKNSAAAIFLYGRPLYKLNLTEFTAQMLSLSYFSCCCSFKIRILLEQSNSLEMLQVSLS